MKSSNLYVLGGLVLLVLLKSSAAQAPVSSPLHRQYQLGDALVYQMHGTNEDWHYTVQANGVVKRDADGRVYEEYRWSNMETAGQPMQLPPSNADFRQRLSLDPDQNPSAPDLSKVDPKMIGPVTDLMTFYADLWLANKLGLLKKAGDHFYFRNPMPASSWADGTHTILGQSAIDFDMTLKSIDSAKGMALLEVRHVPPEITAVSLPAEWMKTPVGDRPNNWVGVTRSDDGRYQAAVGQETFTVEITVNLLDGKILSATMDNPVKTIQRTCSDAALTQCDAATPHVIHRQIDIVLQPDPTK